MALKWSSKGPHRFGAIVQCKAGITESQLAQMRMFDCFTLIMGSLISDVIDENAIRSEQKHSGTDDVPLSFVDAV